jgi:hypothetical protein
MLIHKKEASMVGKSSSDSGSNTSAAKSLNEQNQPILWAVTLFNGIVFAVVMGVDPTPFSKLADAWAFLLPAGFGLAVGLAIIIVINGLIDKKDKHRLVFWELKQFRLKWENPLPGSQAYTVYANNDERFTQADVLEKLRVGLKGTEAERNKEFEEIMASPAKQNGRWYSEVFQPMQDKPAVRQAERWFLFTCDYTAISFLMLIVVGAAGYFVINSPVTWALYCGALALQYLVVRCVARKYGIETVRDAFAAWLQKI